MKISFLGLGQMGGGMAFNLSKYGGDFLVYDINEAALKPFDNAGIKTARNLAGTADADIICLCVPDTQAVEDILINEGGIYPSLRAGQTVVDFSTINFRKAAAIAELLEKKGVDFIDAPVSGRESRAADGTLTIMCGGKEEVFNNIRQYLDLMGQYVVYMGKSGSGQLMKTINGCLFKMNIAAMSELLAVAAKMGLDAEAVETIINSGVAKSDASLFLIPKTIEGDFEYAPMKAGYKDFMNMQELLTELRLPLPTFHGAMSTYQLAMAKGYGEGYMNGMIRPFEDLLNAEFRK
jgi:3-hydroxyisobutyrate dehydrogenase-like beta-hydroxyacid dehydrogenase